MAVRIAPSARSGGKRVDTWKSSSTPPMSRSPSTPFRSEKLDTRMNGPADSKPATRGSPTSFRSPAARWERFKTWLGEGEFDVLLGEIRSLLAAATMSVAECRVKAWLLQRQTTARLIRVRRRQPSSRMRETCPSGFLGGEAEINRLSRPPVLADRKFNPARARGLAWGRRGIGHEVAPSGPTLANTVHQSAIGHGISAYPVMCLSWSDVRYHIRSLSPSIRTVGANTPFLSYR